MDDQNGPNTPWASAEPPRGVFWKTLPVVPVTIRPEISGPAGRPSFSVGGLASASFPGPYFSTSSAVWIAAQANQPVAVCAGFFHSRIKAARVDRFS
jgi:hypothetical protein